LIFTTSLLPSAAQEAHATESLSAVAAPQSRRLPLLGPDISVFLPSSARTRSLFGNAWFSFSPGFGSIERASSHGSFSADLEILSAERGPNHVFLAPIGADFRICGGNSPRASTLPYGGLGANFVVTNLRILEQNLPPRMRISAGASIFVGLTLGKRGYIEARYRAFSGTGGADFSGLQLSSGLRF